MILFYFNFISILFYSISWDLVFLFRFIFILFQFNFYFILFISYTYIWNISSILFRFLFHFIFILFHFIVSQFYLVSFLKHKVLQYKIILFSNVKYKPRQAEVRVCSWLFTTKNIQLELLRDFNFILFHFTSSHFYIKV